MENTITSTSTPASIAITFSALDPSRVPATMISASGPKVDQLMDVRETFYYEGVNLASSVKKKGLI